MALKTNNKARRKNYTGSVFTIHNSKKTIEEVLLFITVSKNVRRDHEDRRGVYRTI